MTQVTGILIDELGTVLANTTCAVVAIDQVVGQDGGGRVSRGSIVVTDGAGEFDADIKPGRYDLVVEVSAPADANVKFRRIGRMTVHGDTMTLEDALDRNAEPVTPSVLQDALAAAQAAADSATAAADSATAAAGSASTATTQAGIATTQAGIATSAAGEASNSAASALGSANSSAISANNSLQSASQAEGFRDQAETFKDGAETAAAAAGAAAGLPSLAGKNGYVLSVSQDGTTVEWAPPQMGAAESFVLSM